MDKKIFRQECLRKLEGTLGSRRFIKNHRLMEKIDFFIKKYNPRSILFYLPMGHEPDIRPLIRKWRTKVNVYVPFMEGKSFKLVQYRLPLYRKRYGIYEPNNSHFYKREIDMAVVPVVGVDRRLGRVGFGKGMYDRFFGSLDRRPLILFVQLEKCYTRDVVTDDYDVVADIYLTPEETITRGKKYVDRVDHRRCGRYR